VTYYGWHDLPISLWIINECLKKEIENSSRLFCVYSVINTSDWFSIRSTYTILDNIPITFLQSSLGRAGGSTLCRSMWTLKLSISKSNKRTSTPINIIYRRSVNIRSIAFVKNIRRLKCFYIFHRSLIKVKILYFSRRFGRLDVLR
jgi:hypothetical protein